MPRLRALSGCAEVMMKLAGHGGKVLSFAAGQTNTSIK
jgi:hypothetical protein